jgi:hypothetical protein
MSMFWNNPASVGSADSKKNYHDVVDEFAEFVEKQASAMQLAGWVKETVDLRRWIFELKRKDQLIAASR